MLGRCYIFKGQKIEGNTSTFEQPWMKVLSSNLQINTQSTTQSSHPRQTSYKDMQKFYIFSILIFLVFVGMLYVIISRNHYLALCKSDSMVPTLARGDLIVAKKMTNYHIKDIVLLKVHFINNLTSLQLHAQHISQQYSLPNKPNI